MRGWTGHEKKGVVTSDALSFLAVRGGATFSVPAPARLPFPRPGHDFYPHPRRQKFFSLADLQKCRKEKGDPWGRPPDATSVQALPD